MRHLTFIGPSPDVIRKMGDKGPKAMPQGRGAGRSDGPAAAWIQDR